MLGSLFILYVSASMVRASCSITPEKASRQLVAFHVLVRGRYQGDPLVLFGQ